MKKLLCWLLGHQPESKYIKTTRVFHVKVYQECTRCHKRLSDPELIEVHTISDLDIGMLPYE